MAEAAVAEVTIIPVSKGATKQIEDQLGGEQAGQKVGGQVGDGLLNALSKTLKVGAVAVGGLAIAGIATVITQGFQRLDALDQATAKLTGLGHSAETVQLIMDNALASVKGTAFGMADAATVAASMVAAGIKPGQDLTRTLSLVGDAATIAGVGMTDMGSIFGKVAASNKAQMDIFNQLADMGVPALALVAQQLGVTQEQASKMASAGEIDFATFQNAMEMGLGGAALASGNTFQGSMDNMGAAAGRLGEKLLSGFFPALKGGFGDLTGWLDSLGPKAAEMGQSFGEFATQALPAVIDGIRTFGDILLNVMDWIGQNTELLTNLGIVAGVVIAGILGFRAVIAVMQAYAAVMAVVKAAQLAYMAATYGSIAASYAGVAATNAQKIAMLAGVAAQRIGAAVMGSSTAAMIVQKTAMIAGAVASGVATAAQWAFNAAMSANPIMIVVLAIAALIAGLVWFFTQTELGQEIWANFTQFLGEAWDNIVAGFQAVVGFFGEAWANISQFFTDAYNGVIKPIIDGIGAVFTWLYENIILPIITGIIIYISIWVAAIMWLYDNVIAPVFAMIGAVFTWVFETIIQPIINGIANAILWVGGVIAGALEFISAGWQVVWGGISSFFTMIWDFIVLAVTTYINTVMSIITVVIDAISAAWNFVWGGISSFFGTIWNGIVSAVTMYVNLVRSIITNVVNAISGVWNSIWGGISSYFIGVWDSIMGVVNTVGAVFGSAFSNVASIVSGAFEGVVSIIRGVINSIIDVVNGAINGINSVASTIGGALGIDIHVGNIPRLEKGALVRKRPGGIIANIGEGRYDEAVVPMSPKILDALGGNSRSGGKNITVENTIMLAPGEDPRVAGRQFARSFEQQIAGVV